MNHHPTNHRHSPSVRHSPSQQTTQIDQNDFKKSSEPPKTKRCKVVVKDCMKKKSNTWQRGRKRRQPGQSRKRGQGDSLEYNKKGRIGLYPKDFGELTLEQLQQMNHLELRNVRFYFNLPDSKKNDGLRKTIKSTWGSKIHMC